MALPIDLENMPPMAELLDAAAIVCDDRIRDRGVQPMAAPHTAEECGASSGVDAAARTIMDRLLAQTPVPTTISETVAATIVKTTAAGITVDIGLDVPGFIPRDSFHGWKSLREGDELLVEVERPGHGDSNVEVKFHKILARHSKSSHSRKTSPPLHAVVHKGVVIDGSNVCRSYSRPCHGSTLAPLLTLATALAKQHISFHCIFDASEPHALAKNASEPNSVRLYDGLLREFAGRFREAPAGTDADSAILALAHRGESSIVSNDRFDKLHEVYRLDYPWLQTATKRLIKGYVDRDVLQVPALGIAVPLRRDLAAMYEELRQMVHKW